MKPDDDEMVQLPLLETSFIKHKLTFSSSTLVELVTMSLRSLSMDNYNIAILAIEENIKRKDLEAQKLVIKQFNEACEYYDFGHRFWENTVHDQLFDDLFPKFDTAALIELLDDAPSDMLNCDGGDGGDQLFIPAFEKCNNNSEFDLILSSFFKYVDESLEYRGLKYFHDLQNRVLSVLSKKYHTKFKDETIKSSEKSKLLSLLESDKISDIVQLIHILGKEENAEFLKLMGYQIIRKVNEMDFPLNEITFVLDLFINNKLLSNDISDTLLKYMFPKDSHVLIEYLKTKENDNNREYVSDILDGIIYHLHDTNSSLDDISPFRDYLKIVKDYKDDSVFAIEIMNLYETIVDSNNFNEILNNYLKGLRKLSIL